MYIRFSYDLEVSICTGAIPSPPAEPYPDCHCIPPVVPQDFVLQLYDRFAAHYECLEVKNSKKKKP